jgi:hypothetical protein
MSKLAKVAGLVALFAVGAVFAGTVVAPGRSIDITTLVVTTTDTPTTAPGPETVILTETVEQTIERTTTRRIPVQAPATTTAESTSESSTPAWVWVLVAVLAAGLIVVIVLLARRGSGGGISVEDRRRHLDAAVASWTAQGWAIENQTNDSTVLRRGAEAMIVTVDQAGHASTRPFPAT